MRPGPGTDSLYSLTLLSFNIREIIFLNIKQVLATEHQVVKPPHQVHLNETAFSQDNVKLMVQH